jgi:hypothetical protein
MPVPFGFLSNVSSDITRVNEYEICQEECDYYASKYNMLQICNTHFTVLTAAKVRNLETVLF